MMALHGHAALWWDNVEGDTENLTCKQIKSLFTDYFGGDDAAVSAAIAKMVILRQNKESMVTFGTKLMTHIRRSTNESPMQMYFFYRAVDKDTAQMVVRREPKSLKEAVDYAIRMERLDLERRAATSDDFNRGVAQLISFGNPGKNSTSVPHADSDSEPMEGVIHGTINAQQRSRKLARKSPQDSGCYVCGKSGHIAKECYSRYKKGDNKQKRGYSHHKKSYRQNEQAVRPANAESDIEEESNLFAHMYNLNCQQVEPIYNETQTISTNAMTEKELENDPRRFSVNMQLSGQNVSVLIDTGAMISTIRDDQVDQLQLTQESAPNMWIEYGNSSREVSNTTVSIQFQVEEATPFNFSLRVVNKQNVPVILVMDFFIKTSVLLDPINKTIVPRHNTETAIQQQDVQKVNNNNEDLIPEISEAMKLYPSIFKTESIQSITNAPVEHQIDTGDARPIVKKGRRLSPKEKQALQDEVDKMLKAKVIRPSNSPWSSPPILVPKPDGSMRLCNNYRGINAVTKKDKYPLPRMDDLIDKLSGAQWFSSIDLKSGYWQIPVAEQDKCKTAFTTPSGLYEYNVMPFGLTNAPATFARFMAQILGTFPNAIV
ncbi:hypothetical protein G6F62_009884 [Rhizopus arrhizus]|nr:hypothetical protein G6F23_010517 [Rhizopus arrhizus]KAG0754772.1 hypothetical protein G6F24_012266 [Rhizopus arrhizus]KAG0905298.1 hypothetical protein G6F33_012276 [Rhizopus arrhizus]KAG1279065.1 hypothetical protein G6F66_011950 [Rhizopus arrhizus]KAG1323062.1 hypothetical protein G6F62_009884 [Rhizopus arrhizus]